MCETRNACPGFIVTFGSAAMGSAIMAMGVRKVDDEGPRGGRLRLVALELNPALQQTRSPCEALSNATPTLS